MIASMKVMRILQKRTGCCDPVGSPVERRYPGLEEGAKLFKALGDETRLAIIRQLQEQGEVCACDFSACCDLAQPTVSHHLKVLRDAGVVKTQKQGLWVYYSLNSDKLEALRAWLP
jgi:ArsR family transcriptional regulator, arsenate/arsenite/antimonite-responsive transcriptional repressor